MDPIFCNRRSVQIFWTCEGVTARRNKVHINTKLLQILPKLRTAEEGRSRDRDGKIKVQNNFTFFYTAFSTRIFDLLRKSKLKKNCCCVSTVVDKKYDERKQVTPVSWHLRWTFVFVVRHHLTHSSRRIETLVLYSRRSTEYHIELLGQLNKNTVFSFSYFTVIN